MKALLASSTSDDFLAAVLWDGLQEVLGEDNVADAGAASSLHSWSGNLGPCARVGASRPGRCLAPEDGAVYDLLILCSSLLTEHDWHWTIYLRDSFLKQPGGQVVWVDMGDHPHDHHRPPFPCDAYFRREVDPVFSYPVPCHPLLMAAPLRWFDQGDHHRRLDVFFAGHHGSSPVRWDMLQAVWKTQARHTSIVGSTGLDMATYLQCLHDSKIVLCPPGAGSDCMRTWEAIAAGAIPLFVEHPPRRREPWFYDDEILWCSAIESLPEAIDHALGFDLAPMRRQMQFLAMKHHTTAARARQVLKAVGL